MRAMGLIHLANRTLTWETLHLLPEFGTALAYCAAGLPKLWW